MELELRWNKLFQTIAKTGAYTMTEIKKMSLREFFITLTNLKKEWQSK